MSNGGRRGSGMEEGRRGGEGEGGGVVVVLLWVELYVGQC